MGRSRNLADLLDANGDVKSGFLDNVPPSNDASALTTGTLSADRLAAGSIGAAKLADTYLTPTGDGSGLSGIASDALSRDFTVETGKSVVATRAVNVNSNGKIGAYPQPPTVGSAIDTTSNHTDTIAIATNGKTGLRYTHSISGTVATQNLIPYVYGADGAVTIGSTYSHTATAPSNNQNQSSSAFVRHIGGNCYAVGVQAYGQIKHGINDETGNAGWTLRIVSVNESTGAVTSHYSASSTAAQRTYFYGYGSIGVGLMGSDGSNTIVYLLESGSWGSYYRTVNVNLSTGSTSQITTSSSNLSGNSFVYGGNNNVGVYSGATGYFVKFLNNTHTYQTISGSAVNAITTATSVFFADYSADMKWMGAGDLLFAFYTSTAAITRMAVVKVDLTDGSATVVSNQALPDQMFIPSYYTRKSATEHIFASDIAFNTIETDANGNIQGYGSKIVLASNYAVGFDGSTARVFSRTASATTSHKVITINEFASPEFVPMGVAKTSASTGNVSVVVGGIADGYTGLTVGTQYYTNAANNNGSLVPSSSDDAGSLVGVAISSTELLLTL
jgi:hypothetical protein